MNCKAVLRMAQQEALLVLGTIGILFSCGAHALEQPASLLSMSKFRPRQSPAQRENLKVRAHVHL